MIEVEHLTKRYGALTAIEDVSFHLNQGEIVGFLGVNGAGKTTTMRILTGYMPPSEGRASIAGYNVLTQSLEARRRMGYVPETVPLYTEMAVYEYLDYMARLRGLRQRREARIYRAMELVAVDRLAGRIIGTLSKGQRQRVGIAQAIVHNPDVLILDEPTIGLDPRQIREVRQVIRDLGRQHTILLSTHILPEVAQVCDRVIIISNGRVRADMTIGEATRGDIPERITARVTGPADDVLAALRALPHVADVHVAPDGSFEVTRAAADLVDVRPAVAGLVASRGWSLFELRASGLALEDLFLSITGEDIAAAEAEEEEEYEDDEEAGGDEEEYEDDEEEDGDEDL